MRPHRGLILRDAAPRLLRMRGNSAPAGLSALQALQRLAHIGIESRAAGIKMREDLFPHPRVPELPDMLGDARNGLVVTLALEEFADLVGHVDQAVRRRRHWRPL